MKTKPALDTLLEWQDNTQLDILKKEFIKKVFFLPKEILEDKEYQIEQMKIISAEEWYDQAAIEATRQKAMVHFDPSPAICSHAKYLGISVRRSKKTKAVYIVVKLWYTLNGQIEQQPQE